MLGSCCGGLRDLFFLHLCKLEGPLSGEVVGKCHRNGKKNLYIYSFDRHILKATLQVPTAVVDTPVVFAREVDVGLARGIVNERWPTLIAILLSQSGEMLRDKVGVKINSHYQPSLLMDQAFISSCASTCLYFP